MRITKAKDGKANLHIWRTGKTYEHQKGAIYRKEWNNILFSVRPQPKDESAVKYYDIRNSLPFPNETFDAVFALHVIEHLTPQEGETFVKEIFRVLKPGGVVRISTPDLEDICRSYLDRLEECMRCPTEQNIVRYEWSVYELLDQFVREKSGGLMVEAIKRGYFDPEYAKKRYGDVFEEFYVSQPARKKDEQTPTAKYLHPILSLSLQKVYTRVIRRLKRLVLNVCLGNGAVLPENHPRVIKEANLWMYDRLSLQLLLNKQGFVERSVKDYKSSDIFNWAEYNLEQSNYGDHAIEPSLYVEAKKPPQQGYKSG